MYPFAPILPNEHLTGYLGRLYALSARATLVDTVRDFGIKSNNIYPYPLYRAISPKLLDSAGIRSIDMAWRDHTLTLYGLRFLNRSEQQAVKAGVVNSPSYPKVAGHNLVRSRNWRWCNECVISDTERYGISYYHRDHQIPGVYHCQLHSMELCDGCSHCGFLACSLKALPIPPLANLCPNCGNILAPPKVYFSDQMAEIGSISLALCRTQSALTIEEIISLTFKTVGVASLSNPSTSADRRVISRWYKELIDTADPRALDTYFVDRPNGTAPAILRKRALFSTHPKREPLHPLAHLFVLQNRGINLKALFNL